VKTKTREISGLIQNSYGRGIKNINENYGIAVVIDPKGGSFKTLLDSFDLFLGNTSCKEMGKRLSDLIKVGDRIRYNAILIRSDRPLVRDIRYLATAVVFASTQTLMRTRDIPGTAPKVTQAAQLEPGKVKNFHAKTRPQLLVNHLQTLQPHLNARTLELTVPQIEHPSEIFLTQQEEASKKPILLHDKTVVFACLSCLGNATRNFTRIRDQLVSHRKVHKRDPEYARLPRAGRGGRPNDHTV
jgi:hypothetical protein